MKESPVWLERQRHLRDTGTPDTLSIKRLFAPDLLPVDDPDVAHDGRVSGVLPLHHVLVPDADRLEGAQRAAVPGRAQPRHDAGQPDVGRSCRKRAVGRRGAATIATAGGVLLIPIYLFTTDATLMLVGAFLMGIFGAGNFGVIPTYLNERFPTAARAVGAGFSYHVGAFLGSFTTFFIGHLRDGGLPLNQAMAWCIGISGIAVIVSAPPRP